MFSAKNTTIAILVAVIVFFIRERRLTKFNASLHNVIHNSYLPPQVVNQKLKNHTSEFSKEQIIEVTPGVWVAIGYALANSVIIEGDTSLIIVDTMESVESCKKVRKDFAEKTKESTHLKPISTIIYTHYHPDHTFGTAAYIDDINNPPLIISHPKTLREMTRILSVTSSIVNIRATRQFGSLLHEYDQHQSNHHHNHGFVFKNELLRAKGMNLDNDDNDERIIDEEEQYDNSTDSFNGNMFSNVFENSGIGPYLASGPQYTKSLSLPTKLLKDPVTNIDIDGIKMVIYHAPGETTDQIFIYLIEKRVLLPADNIYKTYPNIYAIRGSPTRNARDWTQSLDKMRSLQPPPKYLIPSHTKPVYGSDTIYELLTVYRDGISYTHDQTIRYMNTGLTPDQMIPLIHKNMPERLKNHPYLQEFYGTIDWSVRGIFHSYLGWFSGDPADLFPLPKTDLGDRMIELLKGDIDHILIVIQEHIDTSYNSNIDRNSCQWGLKLATEVMHSSKPSKAQKQVAKDLRITALQCMASFMTSANGRNYYLTSALEEITGSTIVAYDSLKEFVLNSISMDLLISSLRVRLKVDKVPNDSRNISVCHDFHDTWYLLEVRDGIIEVFKGYEDNKYKDIDETSSYLMKEAHIDRFITKEECFEKATFVTLCKHQVFRDAVAATKTTPAMLYASGKFKIIKGNIVDMVQFRDLFEKN